MSNTEAVWAAKYEEMAQHLNRRCDLEKACNELAQQHIQAYRKSEQNRLTQRLEDAASKTDAILPALAWLRQCLPDDLGDFGGPKLANAAPMLAAALLAIRDHLLDDQECQDMDEAGAIVQQRVEQLADQILAEVKAETLAYKSQTRVRLRRLINCVDQWQEKCADDDERTQLVGICTELLYLCDHLGVIRPKQAGGAA
jgi:hypothetical protein